MSSITILRESPIIKTPRVLQMEGIFDIPPSEKSTEKWQVELNLPSEWNIGLIVGPSGCGKSTIARELFGDYLIDDFKWSKNKCVIDDFPAKMSIKEISELFSSIGFSSPPSWLRPYHVLSNGEQFRVRMARTIASNKKMIVIDEFTSVVDRNVAKIGSAAIQKCIRRRNQKLIAVSCHYDIAEWLEPDWIYQPANNEFASGRYLRRPSISLEIKRVHRSAWQLFKKYHYLSGELSNSARCFVAFWNNTPIAFCGVISRIGFKNSFRVSRLVVLPDYQGIGVGTTLLNFVGDNYLAINKRFYITTSLPSLYHSLIAKHWRIIRKPSLSKHSNGRSVTTKRQNRTHAISRFTSSFEYREKSQILKKDAERLIYGEIGKPR